MNLHPGLLSGLVLAGANQPVDPTHDDGILTALEVEELDLSGMELATLSACQTGLGKAVGGEGALGLQRAFQIAGARHGRGQPVVGRGSRRTTTHDRLLRKPVAKETS